MKRTALAERRLPPGRISETLKQWCFRSTDDLSKDGVGRRYRADANESSGA
ncbi:hypothetical protein [Endothiovibrio diazotrophicus]